MLAPAADERISAGWVKEVAKAFKKDRFKNVFMNQPFGCDQCRILGYLNDAADALERDEPKLAKSFVRRALAVLNQGQKEGWYTESDIQAVEHLIMRKANQGLKEAGAAQYAFSASRGRDHAPRYESGDEPVFSRSEASDSRRESDRWTGYTDHRRYGWTERLDRDRESWQSRGDSRGALSRQLDDGRYTGRGTAGYYNHDIPIYGKETDQRDNQDRNRRNRTRFPEEMTAKDALNSLMEQDEDQQS